MSMSSLIALCSQRALQGLGTLNASFPPISFLWFSSSKFIVIQSRSYSCSSYLEEAALLESEGCC